MIQDDPRISIVGAGLGGALLAASLAREGYEVEVFELRPDLRKAGAAGGKSINLALSHRGIEALRRIGVAEDVLEEAVPMYGRIMHSVSGKLTYQPYGKQQQCINSVSRGGLNMQLLSAAENAGRVKLNFQHKCTTVDIDKGNLGFLNLKDNQDVNVSNTTIVGADGAFSAVRARMQRRDLFNFRQDYLPVGYKEMTIPAGSDGQFAIEKNVLHIWPRGPFMMIALPNIDGSFTCTLFWPHQGENSFAAVRTEADVVRFFEKYFPDAVSLMPTLVEDYLGNPQSSLVTVRCGPWNVDDRCVLIGDAAHAVVPFYGQGMNAAFEDVVVLVDAIRRNKGRLADAFESYYQDRKPHCDVLAQLAIDNFEVMSKRTRSTYFLVRKRVESILHKLFPKLYFPIYSMVTFSSMGYADAVKREENQNKIACIIAAILVLAGAAALVLL